MPAQLCKAQRPRCPSAAVPTTGGIAPPLGCRTPPGDALGHQLPSLCTAVGELGWCWGQLSPAAGEVLPHPKPGVCRAMGGESHRVPPHSTIAPQLLQPSHRGWQGVGGAWQELWGHPGGTLGAGRGLGEVRGPQSVRGQGVGSVSQPDVSRSRSQAHLIQSSRRGRASGARPPTRDRTGWDGTGRALPDSAWPVARVRHGLSPAGQRGQHLAEPRMQHLQHRAEPGGHSQHPSPLL